MNAFYAHIGCTELVNLNGHICPTDSLGHLVFESLDDDRYNRTASPITVESPDLPLYKNVLNSFRDKNSNVVLGQERLSRFAVNVFAPAYEHYTYKLTYTGTVPQTQRFALKDTPGGIVIQIKYGEQNSYRIRNADNGMKIKKPLGSFSTCGENSYTDV